MDVTRDAVRRAVATLFVNRSGDTAERLVLVNDTKGQTDLGGLSMPAVVGRLCEQLGIGSED